MRIVQVAVVTAVLLVVLGGALVQERVEIGTRPHTINVDGRERVYRVAVPPRETRPMPLVLVLHGGGFGELGALHVIRYTQFTRLALREGFIAAYPVGVDGNWNDGRGVDFIPAQAENVDDVAFIRRVVDDIADKHPVDRSRVFATGISNGAFMSQRLAAEASDLVAGIAPVVGGMAPAIYETLSPEYPVSLFILQGAADPLVPIDGGVVGLRGTPARGVTVAIENVLARYLDHYGIEEPPTTYELPDTDPNDGTRTEARVYPPGRGGVKVQLFLVHGGGHTWPGNRSYLTEQLVGKTSRDFDATAAIWEFFESCPPRTVSR